jgi:sn-glycerol 3-phosphate transport system ATP-binding protein
MVAKIRLENITKRYSNKEDAILENINLEIKRGEFFVLVGPSGSGKTTLLRMIAGLEDISMGSIYIDDQRINDLKVQDRNLSMVFQNYALYPHMTVKDNILFGLESRKTDKEHQDKRLREVTQMLGIEKLLKRKPKQLSGGQQQRVALARAAVSRMPVCLMDEPLSNLDMQLRTHMRREIKKLQQDLKLTMIYVTHDQTEAMTMGDRICVINEGKIQQVDRPINIYNHPSNQFTAEFIGIPKMNMVEVSELDLNVKQATYVGIRPEHVIEGHDYEVQVDSVEQLGMDTMFSFMLADKVWYAKWPGQHEIKMGDVIGISFKDDSLHFFDQDGLAVSI